MKNIAIFSLISLLCCACDLTGDMNTTNIKGFEFSLYEVQRYCKVVRQGDRYLSVDCKLAKLKPVMRGCEGEIYGGLADVNFQCGADLWVLTDYCHIKMHGITEGGLKCQI